MPKRVLTVAPMPPEKCAYALARYSRSPDSIRQSMDWVRTHDFAESCVRTQSIDWRMESGDRLYRANAYAHFSGGMGATVRTRLGMNRYDNEFRGKFEWRN